MTQAPVGRVLSVGKVGAQNDHDQAIQSHLHDWHIGEEKFWLMFELPLPLSSRPPAEAKASEGDVEFKFVNQKSRPYPSSELESSER